MKTRITVILTVSLLCVGISKAQDAESIAAGKALFEETFFTDYEKSIKAGSALFQGSVFQFRYAVFEKLIPQMSTYANSSTAFRNAAATIRGLHASGSTIREAIDPAYWWLKGIENQDSPDSLRMISQVFLSDLLQRKYQMKNRTKRFAGSLTSLLQPFVELTSLRDSLMNVSTTYLRPIHLDGLSQSFGDPLDVKSMAGKWYFVDLWWLGCGSCRRKHPDYEKWHLEMNQDRDSPVLITIAPDDPEKLETYMTEHDYTFPILKCGRKETEAWGIKVWPSQMLIFPNGKVLNISSHTNWQQWFDFYSLKKLKTT